ncbi:hypothetical protein [Streptomyces sp. NPDC003522]
MFPSQKTAAVAAFVGSVTALCLGVSQAHAEGKADDCRTTVQNDVSCVKKNETYTEKDGTHVIRQEQDCSTTDKPNVVSQQDQLLGNAPTKVGPVVECSNTAELPKGFKKPRVNA